MNFLSTAPIYSQLILVAIIISCSVCATKIEAVQPHSLYSKVTTMLLKCGTSKHGLVGDCFTEALQT